jgi:ABC-type Zn uptake system ZnuABC Zn-binding protein ZnuA
MKIKLPILFNTDSTQSLQNADVDFDLRLCEVRNITFYEINAVTQYFENEIEYSQIYANGMSFYSTLTIKEVENIIENQLNPKFAVN